MSEGACQEGSLLASPAMLHKLCETLSFMINDFAKKHFQFVGVAFYIPTDFHTRC